MYTAPKLGRGDLVMFNASSDLAIQERALLLLTGRWEPMAFYPHDNIIEWDLVMFNAVSSSAIQERDFLILIGPWEPMAFYPHDNIRVNVELCNKWFCALIEGEAGVFPILKRKTGSTLELLPQYWQSLQRSEPFVQKPIALVGQCLSTINNKCRWRS
jgi:hypothetical protein